MQVPRVSLRLRIPGDGRMRRVLLAYLLCDLIEFATWMAVVLVAYADGGAVAVGVASVAMLLPAIVIVPLIAGFGDRMPRGRALSLAHALVGVTSLGMCLLLVLDAPFWSVILGGAVQTIALSLVQPMHYSALPFLALRPGDLVAANGLSSFMDGASLFVGFLVAGVLTDVVGPWVVLLACGLMGLVAALLTTRLGIAAAAETTDDDEPGEIHAAVKGLLALRGNWGALALLALLGCTFLIDGANEPLTLTLNDEVLGLGESTAGLLAGGYGLGLALGGAMQAGLAHRSRLAPVVLAGALVLGGMWMAVALVGALGPALVLVTLAGMGASLIIVSARTLLQRSTDNTVLARVLAIQEGVQMSGQALGSLLAPLAILAVGPSSAFIPIGMLVIITGLVARATVGRLEATSTVRHREVEVLSRVPFLGLLPAYELEHLAQGALWRNVPSGQAVTTQGEPGDTFYVVAAGELSVTVDGHLRDHTLTTGDGFGEIALLHRVPRTATVSALTDCELLTVSAAQFLASVTSSADGTALANAVSDGRLATDGEAG
ncbi:MAG: cyclic nucleotide-binding domain-containing protein [Candidatus Nanopelagicales bacterium]|nr:cyclic nucleotide-binding domain-containing protein [Candidatus Nanopelagicales bacterium]